MNEDQLRTRLKAETEHVTPSPSALRQTEQRATVIRRRRAGLATGAAGLVAAAVIGVGLLVGSGGTGSHKVKVLPAGPTSTANTTTPATAPTVTTGPSPSNVNTTAPTPTTNTTGPASCQTSMLEASLTNTQGTAGTAYSHLEFRNVSRIACTLRGYPGVSFVDAAGHQIGAPVQRSPGPNPPVTVSPGGSVGAIFGLHDAYVGTTPNCQSTTAVGLRIYPPDQTAALLVPGQFTVCGNPTTDGSASIGAINTLANLP